MFDISSIIKDGTDALKTTVETGVNAYDKVAQGKTDRSEKLKDGEARRESEKKQQTYEIATGSAQSVMRIFNEASEIADQMIRTRNSWKLTDAQIAQMQQEMENSRKKLESDIENERERICNEHNQIMNEHNQIMDRQQKDHDRLMLGIESTRATVNCLLQILLAHPDNPEAAIYLNNITQLVTSLNSIPALPAGTKENA